jgi:hypothetical protein
MSKPTRALILGATLAAMNLAGLTAVAQAQVNNEGKDARRPPTERQVGETWRKRPIPSQQQAAADTAQRRQAAQEQTYNPTTSPAQVPAPAPPEPSGQPGWLLASLGGLAAVLALTGGLAWLAARRAGRRARVGHAA